MTTADESIESGILTKVLVGVVRSLTPPAAIELAAEATPLLLGRRLSGSLCRTKRRRARRSERGGLLGRLNGRRAAEVLVGRAARRKIGRGLPLGTAVHLGALSATSAPFEGLHGPATGLDVASEAAQGPSPREGACGGLRVRLGCAVVRRRRLLGGRAEARCCGCRSSEAL
jgi:hypothetical protein